MNLIDANVFIRYLIGDDATKQQKSKELTYRFDRKLDNLPGANRIGL
jgi:predicted nucleic acid-binding protein